MDDFTLSLVKAAYKDLPKKKRTVRDLAARVELYWVHFRDATLAEWAARTEARVSDTKLTDLYPVVRQRLVEEGILYAWETPEDDDVAAWVAWGLACLRWTYREWAGRAPMPDYTRDELADWLAAQQPRQLRLL